MRVLLTVDTVGGVWDYAATLVSGLVAHGHLVRLAVLGTASGQHLSSLPRGAEVVCRDFKLEWMPDAAADVAAAGEWLAREARGWGADLVHLNQLAYAAATPGFPTLVVVHSDVRSWFWETLGCGAPREWDEYARWVEAGLRAADVVVAPTEYQSALASRHYGRGADRVIHNGAPPVPEPARRTAPLVMSAGRAWDAAKGMGVLDAAVGRLRLASPAVHLFGDETGPRGERFEGRFLASHGRTSRAELGEWMSTATVYVAPSLYEPFGLAPLEAALHGCALLLSDIPSFRELWDGCAEFFPRGDERALAAALRRLSADLPRCDALGRAARERALLRYGVDGFVKAYLELYAEMTGREAPGILVQAATAPAVPATS